MQKLRPLDRYYRGGCEHGAWFAMLRGRAALVDVAEAICPECGPVTLTSSEPRLTPDDVT